MKIRMIASVLTLVSMNCVSQVVAIDDAELREIHRELKRMSAQLDHIEMALTDCSNPAVNGSSAWGCYMQDIRAGGVYGVGNTEAEAKGKALERCKTKGGSCFESDLKCSKSE